MSNYDPELIDIETVRERKRLARSGVMTILIAVNLVEGRVVTAPRFIAGGIASASAMKKIQHELRDMIYDFFANKRNLALSHDEMEDEIRILARRYLMELTDKKPVVNVIIVNG